MELTKQFAGFIAKTTFSDLPEDVVNTTKERILDTVGAAVAGEHNWASKEAFLKACKLMGKGNTAVWGGHDKVFPLARAAMINATYAHAIELDDGHKNAGCHAGAVIVPTALMLGAYMGVSGKDIINAVAIGYEVVYRIVAQMTPYQIQKGFHPSSNCDVFGAAAVAGKLLGLSEPQIANALGFAGCMASGFMEATISGTQNKCVQVGSAAYNGIAAAYYAQQNMEGTVTVLEGKKGFFQAESQDVDVEDVVRDLGKVYHISDTYSKMYPTCRHSQAAIEAVLDMVEENDLKWENVASVWVGTHQVAYDLTGIIKEPKCAADAKFSLAYGVALALHEHSVGICHLSPDYWENPVNKRLANLVTVVVDPQVQSYYPKRRGAKVTIKLNDGQTFSKELYDLKGSPKNPVGWKELVKKFTASTTVVLADKDINVLVNFVAKLDKQKDLKTLQNILEY